MSSGVFEIPSDRPVAPAARTVVSDLVRLQWQARAAESRLFRCHAMLRHMAATGPLAPRAAAGGAGGLALAGLAALLFLVL